MYLTMAEAPPTYDSRGIGYVYYDSMRKFSQKVAQCDTVTGEEQTYGELLQRCIGAALGMKKNGLKPGDFISICSLNHFDVTVPYLASLFIGVINSSVDPTMAASEIVFLLNQTMPKIVFVEHRFVDLMEEVAKELITPPLIVVFGESERYTSFSKFLVTSEEEFQLRQPNDLDETTLVIFSSGTTGKPKGICHSHKSMLAAVQQPLVDSSYCTIAWLSNAYWISFYTFLQIWILDGMCRFVFSTFDGNNPWKAFNFKIDLLIMNTTQALTLLKHNRPTDVKADNVRILLFGGSSVSAEQVLELRKKLPNVQVISGCGQSELFGSSYSILFDSKYHNLPQKYPNCVGEINSGILWKIVDIDTEEEILGPNQKGELRVKANYQCKGYHNRDSSETFDSEGWLKTGDLVYYNEDMAFFIANRIRESFKYQQHHIIPSEIERVLLTHPSIEKAVVLGVPHDMDTNHPMAVVKLKKKDSVSEEDIVKYVEERVLHQNRLRAGVKIVEKIPLTVTDKVNRFKLREMVLHNEL